LGVNTLWLSPIFPSPGKDNGYDVSDYVNVDPVYGSLKDLDDLVNSLKDRDMKLVLDFVPNHSSDEHEWFQKSVKREAPYADYYVWKEGRRGTPPNNWKSVSGGSAWEWNAERGEYYLHQFSASQPDLNLKNPAVMAEMKSALAFWLDRGVDGFKMDAVAHLVEDEDSDTTYNHPEVLELLKEFRAVLDNKTVADSYNPRMMMLDANDLTQDELNAYYGSNFTELSGNVAHMPLNYDFINEFADGTVTAEKLYSAISSYRDGLPNAGAWPNFNVGGHDHKRLATRLGHDVVDVMNMVVMMLPGTPITYYGDELGMEDAASGDNKASRTPMQWDSSENAGFTSGTPWQAVNADYMHVNAKKQLESVEASHAKIYRELAKMRQQQSVLYGIMSSKAENNVFAYSRVKKGNPGYVVAVNLGNEMVTGVNVTEFDWVPGFGVVHLRSHHDRGDAAKEVEKDEDPEAVERTIDFGNFTLRAKEGIVVTFVPTKK
jgi:alpha-glucosidase